MSRIPLLLVVTMVGLYALVTSPDLVIGIVIAAVVLVFGLRWLVSTMFRRPRGMWRR
ncbi:hypothetical protein IRT45_32165 [Nocardia sp. BSTN01]|uniref:hypothetical protein n=1 Tax=Nocardia sp. BSTN01 TaxID=2783665 RepID=UPI00188E39E0|nr:hypothetical protein [Nocardia sp. BSTN01]MBF5001786.1 hypothetical protein [Nocardia sp. BSTN01]